MRVKIIYYLLKIVVIAGVIGIFGFHYVLIEAKQQEVSVMASIGKTSPSGRLMYQFFEEFEKENPDIKIVVEDIPSNKWQDIKMIRFAAGKEGDVIIDEINRAVPLVEAGLFAEVPTNLIREMQEDFVETSVNTVKYPDGKYYGIPYSTDCVAMFYNKKLLREAGLSIPSDDWTWKDFEQYAKKLTKRGVKGELVQSGFTPWLVPQHVFWPWYWSNGGTWSGFEGTVDDLLTQEAIEAMDFAYVKVWQVWKIASTNLYADGQKGFLAEKVAMYNEGPWRLQTLIYDYPSIEYGVVAVPKRDEKPRYTVLGGWNFFVAKKRAQYEPAWRLVQFLTSSKAVIKRAEEAFLLPTRKSVVKEINFAKLPKGFKKFIQYMKFAKRKPCEGFPILMKAFPSAVEKIMSGQITDAKEALKQIVKEYKFEMGL